MPATPSGAVAGAAVTIRALADNVAGLAAALPLPEATARAADRTCRVIAGTPAPRMAGMADAAALTARLVALVQAIGRDADPAAASAALYALAPRLGACVPVSASPALTRAYRLAGVIAAALQAACLGEAFLAEARTGFADQQAAAEARERITAALEAALDDLAARLGEAVAYTLTTAAQQACAYLVDSAASLAPLVRVGATRSYPSTALAWSLYGDPARAPELLARARVGTPLFLPASFLAAAPRQT